MEKDGRFWLVLGVFLSVLLIIGIMSYMFPSPTSVVSFDMHLRVANYGGLNADTDKLWFGTIPVSGAAERGINVSHAEDKAQVVKLVANGDLVDYTAYSDNGFVLEPNEVKEVRINVNPKGELLRGEYTGRLDVLFYDVR